MWLKCRVSEIIYSTCTSFIFIVYFVFILIVLFKGDPGADGPEGEPGPLVCSTFK